MAIVGGHSIDDPEPKYGLAVTGVVHPDRVVRNSTGRPGDVLFLTKPLGGGAVTTAAKRGIAPARRGARVHRGDDDSERRRGRRGAVASGPSAMTDVTGFGLLGHLHELALASGVERTRRGGCGAAARRRARPARRRARSPAAAAETGSGSSRTCAGPTRCPSRCVPALRRDDLGRAAGRRRRRSGPTRWRRRSDRSGASEPLARPASPAGSPWLAPSASAAQGSRPGDAAHDRRRRGRPRRRPSSPAAASRPARRRSPRRRSRSLSVS